MKTNTKYALILLAVSLLLALPAAASHPSYDDMAEVKRLAHEAARAARHLHENAEAEAHHFNGRESYAVKHLHQLAEATNHFHSQVERFFKNPRHTERDFRRLYASYREAVDSFHLLHAYDHLNSDLRSVRRPMERLASFYGYGNSYPGYDDMAEVKRLAHEAERAARHLHHNAEAEEHHFSRRESYALKHLHQLAEATDHFHGQVERFFRNPRHTERDFKRLYAAYREAIDSFHLLHAYDHLNTDLRSVRQPMERLASFYGHGNGYRDEHGHYDQRQPSREHH